jgi:hypothetical protein
MQAFNEDWVNGVLEGWRDGQRHVFLSGLHPDLHESIIPIFLKFEVHRKEELACLTKWKRR